MKSSLLITFAFAFGFVACTSAEDVSDFEKQQKAVEECNALFPIPNNPNADPREKLILHVIQGERIDFHNKTWCTLDCVLKKVGFFDENSNMRPPSIFKYNIKTRPELAKYADVFAMRLFQNYRSTNDYEDKCVRAYVAYYRYVESVFVLSLANNLNNDLQLKEKVLQAVEEGKPLPEDIQTGLINYLKDVNKNLKERVTSLNGLSSQQPAQASLSLASAAIPA